MCSLHLLLLIIIIASAANGSTTTEQYPNTKSELINPYGSYYTTAKPDTSSGFLFSLLGLSLNQNTEESENNEDSENNDIKLNLNLGFFAGIEDTSRNLLDILVRKVQSILNTDESYNDGLLGTLLQGR